MSISCLLTYSEALSRRPADYGHNNLITGDFVMPAALAEVGVRPVIGAGWSNLPTGGDAQLFRVGW